MTIDEQLKFLRKGSAGIIRENELRAKLEKAASSGKPLRVKIGVDPPLRTFTSVIPLSFESYEPFQELGDTVIFLIGDFTGLIGDPSGNSTTLPGRGPSSCELCEITVLDH